MTATSDGRVTAAVYGDAAREGDKYDVIGFANSYRYPHTPEELPRPSPKTGDSGLTLLAALALSSGAGLVGLGSTAAVAGGAVKRSKREETHSVSSLFSLNAPTAAPQCGCPTI